MKLCIFWLCFCCSIQRMYASLILQKIRPDQFVKDQNSFSEKISYGLVFSNGGFSSGNRNVLNRFELELYQNMLNTFESSSERQATEIRFIKPSIGDEQELTFNISYLSNGHNVTKTHLMILLSKDKFNLSVSINDKVLFTSRSVGVVKFDVTDVIRGLPTKTSTLKIKVNLPTDHGKNNHSLIEELSPVIAVYESLINVNLESLIGNTRKRRSMDVIGEDSAQNVLSNDVNNTETSSVCSLRPWVVDFSVIGWDFVLAPVSYQANICSGLCTVPLSQPRWNSTNYAFIKSAYRITPDVNADNIPPACCTPITYAPLSVLIDWNNSLIIRRFSEMIVTSCGCR